jgi:hypothetical protein
MGAWLREKNAHVAVWQKSTQNVCGRTCAYETHEAHGGHANRIRSGSRSIQLGYAQVGTEHQSLDQQLDALTAVGMDSKRVGALPKHPRPGLWSC